jgi:hypothetical protein
MGDIDGEWESVAQSPIGEQRNTVTFTSQPDGSFTGSSTGPMGSSDVIDGKVEGDQVSWKVKITKPFPMTLTIAGTLSGDTIDGNVDTGAFGKFPMKATRKA